MDSSVHRMTMHRHGAGNCWIPDVPISWRPGAWAAMSRKAAVPFTGREMIHPRLAPLNSCAEAPVPTRKHSNQFLGE